MREDIQPFLKWAGGKRWLISKYSSIFPKNYKRYIEPFVGSGAVYFGLKPKEAILADINTELIACYQAIKTNWQLVENWLANHQKHHNKDYYYKIRNSSTKDPYKQAARFIYLNRTCWNGLYRVNLKGEFNVPIGTKSTVLTDSDNFSVLSKQLENAELLVSDFETIIDKAGNNDLLFVDPPYTVKHNLNGFIKYNERLFSWDDQIRLRDSILRAKKRGVHIILTNANHESVRELYRSNFELATVARHSVIAANPTNRKICEELIVRG